MINRGALIVFGKSPVPGNVKTRLIPHFGRDKATSLYKELLDKTIRTAINAGYSEVQLWIDGNLNNEFLNQLRKRHGIKFYSQRGNGLGKRMSYAFDKALEKYPYVVLIGSDCPSMLTSDLSMASEYLMGDTDIVLGPAKDGGYYLIGLKINNNNLFENIKWSSAAVFDETCQRINKLKWKLKLLPERRDLDRPSDFNQYLKMNHRRNVN